MFGRRDPNRPDFYTEEGELINAYAFLGLGPDADESAIKAAHRRIMREAHPDRHGPAGEAILKFANAIRTILLEYRGEYDAAWTACYGESSQRSSWDDQPPEPEPQPEYAPEKQSDELTRPKASQRVRNTSTKHSDSKKKRPGRKAGRSAASTEAPNDTPKTNPSLREETIRQSSDRLVYEADTNQSWWKSSARYVRAVPPFVVIAGAIVCATGGGIYATTVDARITEITASKSSEVPYEVRRIVEKICEDGQEVRFVDRMGRSSKGPDKFSRGGDTLLNILGDYTFTSGIEVFLPVPCRTPNRVPRTFAGDVNTVASESKGWWPSHDKNSLVTFESRAHEWSSPRDCGLGLAGPIQSYIVHLPMKGGKIMSYMPGDGVVKDGFLSDVLTIVEMDDRAAVHAVSSGWEIVATKEARDFVNDCTR